jgi:hypothetical protein
MQQTHHKNVETYPIITNIIGILVVIQKHQIYLPWNKYLIHVWECYVCNYFLEEKLVYFHQYPLNASFHQFLDSFINNDYANLCIWIPLKLLKNCPLKKLSARKNKFLLLIALEVSVIFNTLEVFDREQSRICHLNTRNLLLYRGTFFHLCTSKRICTQWMEGLRISSDQSLDILEIWLPDSQ